MCAPAARTLSERNGVARYWDEFDVETDPWYLKELTAGARARAPQP